MYYGDSVKLESCQHGGLFLHTSDVPYSPIPSATNPKLPPCLQTGQTMETNLFSAAFETFEVKKYARFHSADALRTGRPFRLYHSQSESFVSASCDEEKDRKSPEGRESLPLRTAAAANGSFKLPAHCPYLKRLKAFQDTLTPQPSDPSNHAAVSE